MPPYAYRCHNLNRPMATAQPNAGGHGRQPWPLASRTTSGRCVKCYCSVCRRGRSHSRGKRLARKIIVGKSGPGVPAVR